MKKALFLLLVLFVSQSAYSQVESYLIPVTRDGVKETRLVYNLWSDEYPSPVINVSQDMEISAHASVRKLDEVKSCTIEKGIYHPWSQTKNSIEVYYTITERSSYKAKADTVVQETFSEATGIGSISVKKGDRVDNIIYLSEGWCLGDLVTKNGTPLKTEFICDSVVDNSDFQSVYKAFGEGGFFEQWMYLSCAEGYNAFVKDSDLLEMPHVKEGQILGYGEVGQ